MVTVIAYIITMVAIYFSITALPQMLIVGLLAKVVGILPGALLGSIFAWLIVDLLWFWFAGGHIPIAALCGALGFLFLHGAISKDELTETSRWMMTAEAWAIILVGIVLVVIPNQIRWY